MKKKIKIYENEWWPVYCIDDENANHEIEIDESDLKKFKKVFKEFSNIQNKLRDLFEDGK